MPGLKKYILKEGYYDAHGVSCLVPHIQSAASPLSPPPPTHFFCCCRRLREQAAAALKDDLEKLTSTAAMEVEEEVSSMTARRKELSSKNVSYDSRDGTAVS